MSQIKIEKKINIPCIVCGTKVAMTQEECKQEKFVEQYIIRSSGDSVLTALQLGTLCEVCSNKPLHERIRKK